MTNTVYIVRGPSGAGKGHYIQHHIVDNPSFDQVTICSADHYFEVGVPVGLPACGTDRTPEHTVEYNFDVGKLPEAHASCMNAFLNALMQRHACIVVDNTSTRRWEYMNYELAARAIGYEVHIIEIMPESIEDVRLCASRNVHGVPANAIASMSMRFEHDTRATVIPMGSGDKS
jgi:predicted kinase